MNVIKVCVNTYRSPIRVDNFDGHRIEDDVDHELSNDRPILDPPVVLAGGLRLLLDDVDNPLHHFPLKLKVFLKWEYHVSFDENGMYL